MNIEWEMTHAIEFGNDVLFVMHHEGSMYQESEWQNSLPADFTVDENNRVVFQGQAFTGWVLRWVNNRWHFLERPADLVS